MTRASPRRPPTPDSTRPLGVFGQGEHPINDSAEVQRVTASLGLQAAQLPAIAVDLENVAAALVEVQRISAY